MAQTLNILLLTAPELEAVRERLRTTPFEPTTSGTSRTPVPPHPPPPPHHTLFTRLYRAWAHSPAATFALCLFAQAYPHARDIITSLYPHHAHLRRLSFSPSSLLSFFLSFLFSFFLLCFLFFLSSLHSFFLHSLHLYAHNTLRTNEDITVSFLMEMDQLVQLIESPIFVRIYFIIYY